MHFTKTPRKRQALADGQQRDRTIARFENKDRILKLWGDMEPSKHNHLKLAVRYWLDQEKEKYSAYVREYLNTIFRLASQKSDIVSEELLDVCHNDAIYARFFKFDKINMPQSAKDYINAFFRRTVSYNRVMEKLSQRDITPPSPVPVACESKRALDDLLAKIGDNRDVRFLDHDELDHLNECFLEILEAVRDAQGSRLTHNAQILLQAVWKLAYSVFKSEPNFSHEQQDDAKVLERRKGKLLHHAYEDDILRDYYGLKDEIRLDGDAHCIHMFCTTALTYRTFRKDLLKRVTSSSTVLGKRN
jgi:hypothetical protein